MFLIPGVTSAKGGAEILFLVLEVKELVDRGQVLEALKSRECVMWIEICDDTLLKNKMNGMRQLFRLLSRTMESLVTEMSGKSTTMSSLLALAKVVTEQFSIVDTSTGTMIICEYLMASMQAISVIDIGCCLAVVVMLLMSNKLDLFGNIPKGQVGSCEVVVQWSEIFKARR